MNNLAATYGDLGRHKDALRMMEETLAFRRRILPEDHPEIALSMYNLAIMHDNLGRHEDALRMMEDALALFRRIFPEDHPVIAWALHVCKDGRLEYLF